MGYRLLYSNQLQFLLYAATPPQDLCAKSSAWYSLPSGIRFHQAAFEQKNKRRIAYYLLNLLSYKECFYL